MAGDDSGSRPFKTHSGPEVVAPTNKVNIALPFGTIHIEGSNKDLVELASVVAELASFIEGLAPGPKVKELREQAQVLVAKLR